VQGVPLVKTAIGELHLQQLSLACSGCRAMSAAGCAPCGRWPTALRGAARAQGAQGTQQVQEAFAPAPVYHGGFYPPNRITSQARPR